jgi:hydroxymethylglutaryl-CoA reductase (NADPH)
MNELPIIPGRGLVTKLATQLRQDYLATNDIETGLFADTNIDLQTIQNNIESYIGTTEIPLGLVGPLLFIDEGKEELVHCAAGTLEGALIASMNRGAKTLSLSGGVSAIIVWQKMTRAPMFLFETESEAEIFKTFIPPLFEDIKNIVEQYSNHAKLQNIEIIQLDNVVHLKFIYTTGDASGQNMTTTCTWHAMLYIVEQLKKNKHIVPIDFVIEGNGASDKKVSQYNLHSGRGIHVTAECFLPEKIINEVLRTTSEKMMRCYLPSKALAKTDGMLTYNINVANAIAAIFVATGQDLASIHESSLGILDLEKTESGLHLKLILPNLVIGTVGGGTHLSKQSQALELMKCLGSGKVERFAKLIACFALGLEISTFAAIVSGEFAKAHEKLGRNKPVDWLLRSELNHDFILPSLNGYFNDKQIQNIHIVNESVLENGIITNVAARISKKLIGFVPIKIEYKNNLAESLFLNLLLKSKATDEEVIKGLHVIAASIDPALSDLLKASKENLEYKNSHIKEIELYTYLHAIKFENIPAYYGSRMDKKREIFFFIQSFLDYSQFRIINSENNPEVWQEADILKVIDIITNFHQNVEPEKLPNVRAFSPWQSAALYKKLLSILIHERAEQNNLKQLIQLHDAINGLEEEAQSIILNKTVIHNDFNPRNIAIQNDGKPFIYDWELAVIDFPHRDIVECLSFVLKDDFTETELLFYLNYHFQLYENVNWQEFLKAYRYSLKSYIISRVSFYEVSGILIKYDFSKRILNTAIRMLDILSTHV